MAKQYSMPNEEPCPLVSVILPVHNRADVVTKAIQSVLNQTYTNIELLVVDDGSTDDSSAVVHSLADSRTTPLATEARLGVSAARNLGLAHSNGELIAFQDSDDVWLPSKLATQVAFLRNAQASSPETVGVGCLRRWETRKHKILENRVIHPSVGFTQLIAGEAVGTGTPMLLLQHSAIVGSAAQFDELLPAQVERDFLMQLTGSTGGCIAIVPEVLVTVGRGRGDHVANDRNAGRAALRYIDKWSMKDCYPEYYPMYLRQCVARSASARDFGTIRTLRQDGHVSRLRGLTSAAAGVLMGRHAGRFLLR